MSLKKEFMQDGRKFARATQKPRAGQDASTPPALSAQILAVRQKIAQYAQGNGFDESLSGTVSRMYPRFESETICQAVKACSAQGCRNLAGFKNAMLNLAGGKQK